MFSLSVVSDRLLGLYTYIYALQGRDLESAFEAGPSSSSGQQDGREVSFKGVGTFQVDASEQDRLLRKERANAKASMSPLIYNSYTICGGILTSLSESVTADISDTSALSVREAHQYIGPRPKIESWRQSLAPVLTWCQHLRRVEVLRLKSMCEQRTYSMKDIFLAQKVLP